MGYGYPAMATATTSEKYGHRDMEYWHEGRIAFSYRTICEFARTDWRTSSHKTCPLEVPLSVIDDRDDEPLKRRLYAARSMMTKEVAE